MLGPLRRPLWVPLAVILLTPLLFGAEPSYVGCGGPDVPSTGTALPSAELECTDDEDCAATSCADVRCIAGSCVEVALTVDADGDGDSPPPCGTDCDDQRADIRGGLPEICDGLDNDCNMLIDDGAPRLEATLPLPVGDPQSIVLPWGDRFLLTRTAPGAIFGAPVSVGGEVDTSFEILRLTRGAAFTRVVGAAAADGRILIVAQVDDRALRYVIVRPAGEGMELLEGPADIVHGLADLSAVDVIPYGRAWAVGMEGLEPVSGDREQVVFTSLDAPPILRVATMTRPSSFALATDGTLLALVDGEAGVHFFDLAGVEVSAFTLPGIEQAAHPLASHPGAVVALLAGDRGWFELGYIDAVTGLGRTFGAPGDLNPPASVASAGDRVVVSTIGNPNTRIWVLEDDLITAASVPHDLVDASGQSARKVSVADADVGLAVGGGSAGGSAIAVIGACEP